jgi:hypothetical protein
VETDVVEAAKWFRKAAEQNHAEAQYNLGECYYRGKGVTKDYMEAYRWFTWALSQYVAGAKQYLAITERCMTPEQIAEAQRLVRGFWPRKARFRHRRHMYPGFLA